MIIEFTIKNFRSFKDESTISFCEDGKQPHNFMALYGPNGSGKSNVVKALQFMRSAMLNTDAVNAPTVKSSTLQPFRLNTTSRQEPAFFQIVLRNTETNTDYRYGFEADNTEIKSEWLFEKSGRGERTTERILFSRESDSDISFSGDVPKPIRAFKSTVPDTILALPYLANNNYDAATEVTEFVKRKLLILTSDNLDAIREPAFNRLRNNPELHDRAMKALRAMGTAIKTVELEEIKLDRAELIKAGVPKDVLEQLLQETHTSAVSKHDVYDDDGNVVDEDSFAMSDNESLGTQKMLPLITMLLDAEEGGLSVVIDEFGSSLHPFITKAIVELFINNSQTAQLLVITHETYLLSQSMGLSPSQLWVVDKDPLQRSSLICLADYSPRKDARLDKQYLEGRFGAVPIVYTGMH